jgi:hypothetical protein
MAVRAVVQTNKSMATSLSKTCSTHQGEHLLQSKYRHHVSEQLPLNTDNIVETTFRGNFRQHYWQYTAIKSPNITKNSSSFVASPTISSAIGKGLLLVSSTWVL